jgi:hypothetical protein
MKKIPQELRRSQLVTTIGVGGMYTRQNGSSVIVCGLDYWLEDMSPEQLRELEIDDFRLRKQLRVGKLYKPPAIIEDLIDDGSRRTFTVPVLRFPTWYACSRCGRLQRQNIYFSPTTLECPGNHKGRFRFPMYQVTYVVMCKSGHLDEFPWNEFVHRSSNPVCNGELRISEAITGDPQNTIVSCGTCKKRRKMSDAMNAQKSPSNRSALTRNLDESGTEFLCQGSKPWLGGIKSESDSCSNDLVPTFRGAGNVYYPFVESSLLIPEGTKRSNDLVTRLRAPEFIEQRNMAKSDENRAAQGVVNRINLMKDETGVPHWIEVENYSLDEIRQGLHEIVTLETSSEGSVTFEDSDSLRMLFRNQEYRRLKEVSDDEILTVVKPDGNYGLSITKNFSSVMLVPSLTETRAFTGFARSDSENRLNLVDSRKLLRREPVKIGSPLDWLPAIQVRGEGIFIDMSSAGLGKWEKKESVINRFDSFVDSDSKLSSEFQLSPSFVLIHTLAHLFMKELTFFCGYSQASLRERIFSSHNDSSKMQGFLIYTASGDSEGTLGGLVRMGKPGFLEEVVQNALEKAMWCSNDPVCMEKGSGLKIGQESSRLASCYACTLVPETSCEVFNSYLDRALVTGVPGKPGTGFFEEFLLQTK